MWIRRSSRMDRLNDVLETTLPFQNCLSVGFNGSWFAPEFSVFRIQNIFLFNFLIWYYNSQYLTWQYDLRLSRFHLIPTTKLEPQMLSSRASIMTPVFYSALEFIDHKLCTWI